jgi:uncharacterized membrane protein
MTRKQFLNALKRELRGLSSEDRRTIMDDYREHFRQSLEAGQSEENIAEALGSPGELAEEAREELGTEKFRETTAGNVVRMSMSGISLLLFNAIVVVGPYAGLVGGMAGLWAGAISILISGVAATLFVPLEPLLRIWVSMDSIAGVMPRIAVFFGGIAVAALGALACIGMIYLTRWFIIATVKYARMTWRIVTS